MQAARQVPVFQEELLDSNYIDGLRRHLGPEVTIDILADGLMSLTDRLNRLKDLRAAKAGRHDLAQSAHDIVGTGGQLGLHRLTHAARQMERAAITESRQKLVARMEETLEFGERSLDALRIFMDAEDPSDFGRALDEALRE